jgi:hypothetical protein
MSKLLYVKKPELKKKPVDKPSTTGHGTLFTIVAVVGVSLLISIGFAYMGYTSGHFSTAYGLCKEDVLAHERIGTYQSVDEITSALGSCDGVTS